ncbi:MAG: SWF/SNF helicase family protein [Chloroflexi bacterium]|nr:SWF/SNF helicase family protein [Chloroflexota bacterium]
MDNSVGADLVSARRGDGAAESTGDDRPSSGGDRLELPGESAGRRRLLDLARDAEKLKGAKDAKLQAAIEIVRDLVKDGWRPIVFCRFIPTAEYVAEELRANKRLPKGVAVESVTGRLPPAERETRVLQLGQTERRVLVATDCLSEGVNLQEQFDVVLHYDLSWNPTRHEQREGRVDRYGQPTPKVRTITYYGVDNQIDGLVLDVLIRKHRTIRSSLGVSVPVPVDTDQVVQAIVEGLLLRGVRAAQPSSQGLLPGFEDLIRPRQEELYRVWEAAADREKRSRTMFAQEAIKVDEVARELRAAQSAVGSGVDVRRFVRDALVACGATVGDRDPLEVDLGEGKRSLREALGNVARFRARFQLPVREGELYLSRTHPIVEGLATYVMDTALDPLVEPPARRCGVIRTAAVARRTTLLLVRYRYHIITSRRGGERQLLAEDCRLLAFAGAPASAQWLSDAEAAALLDAPVGDNVPASQATAFLERVLQDFDLLRPHLDAEAERHGAELLDAHRRVRLASGTRGLSHRVEPQLPADVLGIYMFLPVG